MRLKAFLITLMTGAALLITGLGSPAHAAVGCTWHTANLDYSTQWYTPYASTEYGPVAMAMQFTATQGRAGFYSKVTQQFSPSTGWTPLWSNLHVEGAGTIYGSTNNACLLGILNTPYGRGSWGSEYYDAGSFGRYLRWGTYNWDTSPHQWTPDGGGWRSLVD